MGLPLKHLEEARWALDAVGASIYPPKMPVKVKMGCREIYIWGFVPFVFPLPTKDKLSPAPTG